MFMPIAGAVVTAKGIALCIALLALAFAVQSCWMANQLALISESCPREMVGRVSALSALGGSLGGIVSTLVAGRVISQYGYIPVFVSVGFLHIVGWSILQIGIRVNKADVVIAPV